MSLYLQNIFIPFGSSPEIPGVTWSLAVEEQFYLLWPFLVMRFSRQGLVKICLALLIAPLLWRFGVSTFGLSFWQAYMPLWARVDTLATGALLAVVIRQRWAGNSWALFAAVGVLVAGGTGMVVIGLSIGDLEFCRPQVYSLGFSLTAAFCAGLIFLVLRLRDHAFVRLVFEASWLRLCGCRELDLVVGIRSTGIVLERCLEVF